MTEKEKTKGKPKTNKKATGKEPPKVRGEKRKGRAPYELDPIDHQMLKQIMEYPATTWNELAEITGLHKTTCKQRYDKPSFRRALSEIRMKTWDIIEKAQNLAARRLMKLVQDDDKRIAMEAAKLLMNPILNKGELRVHTVQEVIHRTRFGDQGQLISDTKEIPKETPKNTLELMGDVVDAVAGQ